MICRRTEQLLPAYLDRTLGGRRMAAVKRHIDRCERCRHSLEQYRNVDSALARAARVLPQTSLSAEDGWKQIAARLPAPAPIENPSQRMIALPVSRIVGLAAAATFVIGLSLGIVFARGARTSPEPRVVLEIRTLQDSYNAQVDNVVHLLDRYGSSLPVAAKNVILAELSREDDVILRLLRLLEQYRIAPEQLEAITRYYAYRFDMLRELGETVRGSVIEG